MIDKTRLEVELIKIYENQSIPTQLSKSICYSLTAGGKRIRPILLLEMLQAFKMTLHHAHYQLAAAVEMIHTGSLIHDDLPAMDDDDYRRGELTNHKKFDEATAILAGDSLFLDSYYLLAHLKLPAEVIVQLVRELAYASGSFGMVAGQILDMEGEGKHLNQAEIEQIHALKTGRMLTFPFVAAGIIADKSDIELEKLREIGQKLGLAFQIRDDILDVTATFDEIGKTPGKDVVEEKATYVSLLGLEGAKKELAICLTQVKEKLAELIKLDGSEILKLIESLEQTE